MHYGRRETSLTEGLHLEPFQLSFDGLSDIGRRKKKEGNRPWEGLPIQKSATLNIGASADNKFNLVDLIKIKKSCSAVSIRLHGLAFLLLAIVCAAVS